jgi:hypothetical protein
VNVTDSSSVLQASGKLGLRVFMNSGTTNLPITTQFDDWVVTTSGGGKTYT